MKQPFARGFNLADTMILVAATALGFSMIDPKSIHGFFRFGSSITNAYYLAVALDMAIIPLWLCWTYAALAIRLRTPGPSFRRMLRQPGMVACLAVSLGAPLPIAQELFNGYRRGGWLPGMPIPSQSLVNLGCPFAFLVLGSWFTLWLSGRWRAEPSPIDRFGRLLSYVWVALYVLTAFSQTLRVC